MSKLEKIASLMERRIAIETQILLQSSALATAYRVANTSLEATLTGRSTDLNTLLKLSVRGALLRRVQADSE